MNRKKEEKHNIGKQKQSRKKYGNMSEKKKDKKEGWKNELL